MDDGVNKRARDETEVISEGDESLDRGPEEHVGHLEPEERLQAPLELAVLLQGLLDHVERPLSNVADLGQGCTILHGLDTRLELWQEHSRFDRVVNEFCKVFHHNDGLAQYFLCRARVVQRTLEKGGEECRLHFEPI